ncbi:hypothetical protein C882_2748 [Caenispirillum salinarum AK4]|uniref:Stress induced hydrophobic peptide n=1 Tax=Caenispirillum salinarum AK4 TaxID=1238182 RepID=K9HCF6_9PROT|nr:YqaE/Pmp3 family membrane protein [Caenispirillum salinarum]EKV26456.1 hypothetical protein C882_2748 [Caenispirillum salinarum AK4]
MADGRHNTGTGDSTGGDIIRIILAIILPPLGVFFEVGLGKHFWINVILTILGYIPGIIHALWVIIKK